MHKRTTGLILTGILVTGAVGAVAITPASATTSDNVVTSRLAGIKSALSGLVTNGTLTQAQADKVAGTLESQLPMRGMGGMGGRSGGMGMTQTHDAAAKALGMTSDELYAACRAKSLADVAKDQKVSVDSLVKAMVAAAESELATDVKEGTITQAQADTMKSSLTARITDQVNGVRPGRGQGRGMGGAGWSSSTGNTSGATSSTPSSAT
jgi:Protein of unknown function (DUF2680).